MLEEFKKIGTKSFIESLQGYVDAYKIKYPDVRIKVGTDSKQSGTKTAYVTVVCFERPSKGVHYIYKKEYRERVKDIFTRLFKEAEYSIEVVDYLSGRENVAIHLDYSGSKTDKSSNAQKAVTQWLKSAGYIIESKPDAYAASHAADRVLRRGVKRRRKQRES